MKNRDTIFLVERWTYTNNKTVVIAGFRTMEGADDYAGECKQQWIDRGLLDVEEEGRVQFNVIATTFYDM